MTPPRERSYFISDEATDNVSLGWIVEQGSCPDEGSHGSHHGVDERAAEQQLEAGERDHEERSEQTEHEQRDPDLDEEDPAPARAHLPGAGAPGGLDLGERHA